MTVATLFEYLTNDTLIEILDGSLSKGAYSKEELLKHEDILSREIQKNGVSLHIGKADGLIASDSVLRNEHFYICANAELRYMTVELRKIEEENINAGTK